ncbi:TPA: hypothetical protein ACYU6V_000900 [Klebsiella quasipneumoniae subsp. similipneumoniae]
MPKLVIEALALKGPAIYSMYFSHLAKSRVPAEVQSFIHGEFDGKQ